MSEDYPNFQVVKQEKEDEDYSNISAKQNEDCSNISVKSEEQNEMFWKVFEMERQPRNIKAKIEACTFNHNAIFEDADQPLRGGFTQEDKVKTFYWSSEIDRLENEYKIACRRSGKISTF